MEILIFRTNLTDKDRISGVESYLDVHPKIIRWNVDLEDCDNILRVESAGIASSEVETLLLDAGYYCEDLE